MPFLHGLQPTDIPLLKYHVHAYLRFRTIILPEQEKDEPLRAERFFFFRLDFEYLMNEMQEK